VDDVDEGGLSSSSVRGMSGAQRGQGGGLDLRQWVLYRCKYPHL